MKHQQPHSFQHAFLNAVNNFVRHLGVGDVTPPNQDIRVRQTGFLQAMFRILERRRPDFERSINGQTHSRCIGGYALWIDFPGIAFGPPLVDVFAPGLRLESCS